MGEQLDLIEAINRYPYAAGYQRNSPTSRAAAEHINKDLSEREAAVYAALTEPMTFHELAHKMGLPVASVQPRLSALRKRGMVAEVGLRPSPYLSKKTGEPLMITAWARARE